MNHNNKSYRSLPFLFAIAITVSGCGGGGSGASPTASATFSSSSSASSVVPPECVQRPRVVIDPQAPKITLLGDRIINIPMDGNYLDAGATAADIAGHDLTANIKVTGVGQVNTKLVGDYFVRYDVTDTAGRVAQSQHRIVRVFTNTPINYSLRAFNSTTAPMGFLEHLPTYISEKPNEQYPLLIVAHGWEHFVQQAPEENRLSALTYGANIYLVFDEKAWPDSRPFIVLEPQRCLDVGDTEWEQVDQLIDWAQATYPIDSKRIYMTGMSAGAYFTYRFPVLYPNRLAAIAPMSAGAPVSTPEEIISFCNAMKNMPIWAFHGSADPTVSVDNSFYTFKVLNTQCTVTPTPKPKLTIVTGGKHLISNQIWSDIYVGLDDPAYDVQTESIYDWFLRYSLTNK